MCRHVCVLFCLLAVLFCDITHGHWNYGHQDTWPELCREGKMQSPIGIEHRRAMQKNFPALVFKNYNKAYNSSLKNNGHSVELRLATSVPLTVEGGGLQDTYILDHLHFHWASEHTFDSYRYPLEMHMVHYARKHQNLSSAILSDKGVAVFSVMFDLSPDDDAEFFPLIKLMEKLKENVNHAEKMEDFNVHEYMPRDTAGFYRYMGSLTTPGCNEGVIWTLFTNTIPISENQVNSFHNIVSEEHKQLKKNYRSLQKLNNRHVYLKVSPIHRSSAAVRIWDTLSKLITPIIVFLSINNTF